MTPVRLRYQRATQVIHNLEPHRVASYLDYWTKLVPDNHRAYYERWLFAFMSIRTRWQENVRLFEAVRALPDGFTKEQLQECLVTNHSGMISVRTKGVWSFHHDFWKNPRDWYPLGGETIVVCRDRLVDRIFGMGIAKVSFVMEMAFPSTCNAVCIDTHMSRLYGLQVDHITDRVYRRIEQHWVALCQQREIPPTIARHLYWDLVQGKQSTSYWSHVFEAAS